MKDEQMITRRFTLLADGPGDESLMPVLNWLWRQHRPNELCIGQFADLEYSGLKSRALEHRLAPALDLYPCDLLFIHRDAEKESLDRRMQEIHSAMTMAFATSVSPPAVCVVPVRMSEAWMLFNEKAIRKAAANPNGSMLLPLPQPSKIEQLPDPKAKLRDLLQIACGLPPQRLRSFNVPRAARLVTEFIEDFSPLRELPAFTRMEADFKRVKI
jgi:hypothetical protein